MIAKSSADSMAVLAQMVLPYQANPAGNVHGGEIMKMMDNAAGVAAQKHAHTNVVTARVDELCFRKPVLVGDLVTCTAQVIYAGHSSMEVFVTVEAETLSANNGPQIALTAFFTMVSLKEDGSTSAVPPITVGENGYDQKLYLEGEKRYYAHKNGKHRSSSAAQQ